MRAPLKPTVDFSTDFKIRLHVYDMKIKLQHCKN